MGNFHTEPAGKQEAAAPSTGMGHLQGDTQKGTPKRDTQKGTFKKGHPEGSGPQNAAPSSESILG